MSTDIESLRIIPMMISESSANEFNIDDKANRRISLGCAYGRMSRIVLTIHGNLKIVFRLQEQGKRPWECCCLIGSSTSDKVDELMSS